MSISRLQILAWCEHVWQISTLTYYHSRNAESYYVQYNKLEQLEFKLEKILGIRNIQINLEKLISIVSRMDKISSTISLIHAV